MPARKTAATYSSSAKNAAVTTSINSNSHLSNMTSSNYVGTNSTAFTSRDKRLSAESSSFPSAQDNVNPEKPWYDDETLVAHLLEIASTLHVISVAVNDDGNANNNNDCAAIGMMGSNSGKSSESKTVGGITGSSISKNKESVGNYEHTKVSTHSSDHTRDQITISNIVDAAAAAGSTGNSSEVSSLSQVNEHNIDHLLNTLSQDALKEKKERICCELTFLIASALHCDDYWTNLMSQYTVDHVVELIDYCASCRYSAAKTIHLLAAWEELKKCVEERPVNLHASFPNALATSSEQLLPSAENTNTVEHDQVKNSSMVAIDKNTVNGKKNADEIVANTGKETAATTTAAAAEAEEKEAMNKMPLLQENSVDSKAEQLLLLRLSEFMQREITEGARWRELMHEKAKLDAKNAILYSSNNNGNYNSVNSMGNRRANKGRGDGNKIGGGGGNNKGVLNEEMEKQQKFYDLIALLPQENIYLDRNEELYEFVRLFIKEGLYQHAALFRHNRECVAYEYKHEELNNESCNVNSNNNTYTLYGRDVITQHYDYIIEPPFHVHPLSSAILVTPSSQNSSDESTNKSNAQFLSGANVKKDVTASNKKRSVSKERQTTINTSHVEAAALEHSTHQPGADNTSLRVNNNINAKQAQKSILGSNTSVNSEDSKSKKNSRSSSGSSSKRNSQQDGRNDEIVNTTTNSSTATEKTATSPSTSLVVAATSLSSSSSSHLTQEEKEAFQSLRDEEINRMVERYTAHVEAEAAQRAAEQRTREMTLHLSNEGTVKIVEDVYESMEDELSQRQGKILQRINALEDMLGISSNATATATSRNGSGNSNDAKNARGANKSTKNTTETKNKKSSARPSSSSLKRE